MTDIRKNYEYLRICHLTYSIQAKFRKKLYQNVLKKYLLHNKNKK